MFSKSQVIGFLVTVSIIYYGVNSLVCSVFTAHGI